MLECVDGWLTDSTPKYSGPSTSVTQAVEACDHDRTGTLNSTELECATEEMVPEEVYDDSLLALVRC